MTTTSMFSGLDPEGRSSSRILRPPGGGSSFSFGVGDQQPQQPARRHKMASNIFGIPESEPVPAPCVVETGIPESAACGDSEDALAHRTYTQGEYIDAVDNMVEADVPETMDSGKTSLPAACPEPTPPAVPSRRNPPGGKSSLILG
ncbi:jupiter microtubule associated homolog 1 isoform X2 [Pseudophryne corroboree]|uniref:jupiter microtubule associated homolog 1 isoform X2 n=1 Tax=Pseudophryne corroboree TaxID=495146 RepID=UPI0030812199